MERLVVNKLRHTSLSFHTVHLPSLLLCFYNDCRYLSLRHRITTRSETASPRRQFLSSPVYFGRESFAAEVFRVISSWKYNNFTGVLYTILNIYNVSESYKTIIRCFYLTTNLEPHQLDIHNGIQHKQRFRTITASFWLKLYVYIHWWRISDPKIGWRSF